MSKKPQFVTDKVQQLENNHGRKFDARVKMHDKQVLDLKQSIRDEYKNSVGLSSATNPKPKGQPSHCLFGQT